MIGLVRRLLGRPAPSAPPEPGIRRARVELRGGSSRVVVCPSLGGLIVEMEMAGRQWLVPGDDTAILPLADDAPYAGAAETAGYHDCFPTSAPCTLPTWVQRYGGLALPDHGELWSRAPAFNVATDERGAHAVTTWTGRRMSYVFTRSIGVDRAGAVTTDYRAENTGAEPLPFVWSPFPVFPLGPLTRLMLSPGARVRVWRSEGLDLGGERREHRWPKVRVGDRLLDLSRPAQLDRRFACKVFVDAPDGLVALEESDARLEIRFDPGAMPQVGLWIDRGGWTGPMRPATSHRVSLQPCVGAPDSLGEALGAWSAAQWLQSGEVRNWSMTWRAERITGDRAAR